MAVTTGGRKPTPLRGTTKKASDSRAATPGVNLNVPSVEKPSGCVIWLRFDQRPLAFGPFPWFGREPGERLPNLPAFKTATT